MTASHFFFSILGKKRLWRRRERKVTLIIVLHQFLWRCHRMHGNAQEGLLTRVRAEIFTKVSHPHRSWTPFVKDGGGGGRAVQFLPLRHPSHAFRSHSKRADAPSCFPYSNQYTRCILHSNVLILDRAPFDTERREWRKILRKVAVPWGKERRKAFFGSFVIITCLFRRRRRRDILGAFSFLSLPAKSPPFFLSVHWPKDPFLPRFLPFPPTRVKNQAKRNNLSFFLSPPQPLFFYVGPPDKEQGGWFPISDTDFFSLGGGGRGWKRTLKEKRGTQGAIPLSCFKEERKGEEKGKHFCSFPLSRHFFWRMKGQRRRGKGKQGSSERKALPPPPLSHSSLDWLQQLWPEEEGGEDGRERRVEDDWVALCPMEKFSMEPLVRLPPLSPFTSVLKSPTSSNLRVN